MYGPPPTDARDENNTKRDTLNGGERNGARIARSAPTTRRFDSHLDGTPVTGHALA
jgi:hypothetical protein